MTGRSAPLLFSILLLVLGASNAAAALEVMLELDRSLSMANNDPRRDSLEGIRVFSALLRSDDRLSMATFAETAELRLARTRMTGAEARRAIDEVLRGVKMNGTRTDFGAALRLGYDSYGRRPAAAGDERLLVLFTDGQLNLGSETATREARRAIFDEVLPRYQAAGIRIYGVAFSPDADLQFLERLAEATGGQAFRAERPEDLYAAFVQLFERVDEPLTAPIVDGKVEVDANVQGLELLVRRGLDGERMHLIDPSNREVAAGDRNAGVEWLASDEFDHVRVREPAPGTWRVATSSADKKAYIESDLDLDADVPSHARVGEPLTLTAHLTFRGPDPDPALLEGARLQVRVHEGSGAQQPPVWLEPVAADQGARHFRGDLRFATVGDARIEITADGTGFRRTKNYRIRILDAEAPVAETPPSGAVEPPPGGAVSLSADAQSQRSAAMTLLSANLFILAVLGAAAGLWWWRRRRLARGGASDRNA